jgi:hypothetical protein
MRRPGLMAQPGSLVRTVLWTDAQQILDRALHPVGIRENCTEIGIQRLRIQGKA